MNLREAIYKAGENGKIKLGDKIRDADRVHKENGFLKAELNIAEKALLQADLGLTALLENEEYMECRNDEDCDHCLAKQCHATVRGAMKKLGVGQEIETVYPPVEGKK